MRIIRRIVRWDSPPFGRQNGGIPNE
jgi:hypothetical protein